VDDDLDQDDDKCHSTGDLDRVILTGEGAFILAGGGKTEKTAGSAEGAAFVGSGAFVFPGGGIDRERYAGT
jgi:hypothetical protein